MLVIDAQPLIRQAIGRIVNAEPDLIDVGRLPLPGEGLCDEAVSATFSFSRAPTLVPRNVAKLIRELQVDALICGMHFPTIDGLALVRELKRQTPSLAIIGFADTKPTIIRKSLNAGVDVFVGKGCPITTLIAAVRQALRKTADLRAAKQ